ncbi:NAD(P)/FAD-dependent oxidoreductase [Solidesulfovibrio sp.]|uniref:NAD(P)/FAD-dependent oxidoreductase n=1 Tax=Solidesulfovibrio sp. TaxID=2910990 RepID=UPI002B1EFA2B|nr:NAD(P)/FAD-dependent oxidoreductase [Solidesulfovibrio sp.]MEA4856982.1 NAD(P)/FAD-dependent oxidoreductase [Solidesulfovibrio sp.]
MRQTQCLIIGAGPAGLSAALYTARAGMDTLVAGCEPKIAGDYDIDNYFGFPETISGRELIDRGMRQAERFGARLACQRVLSVHMAEDGAFLVKTDQDEYQAQAVIIAAGVARVRPGIANLADYEGKGVSYCVSCDGFFFRGRAVAVVGEGNYAANQALELTNFTSAITVYTQGKQPAMGEVFTGKLAAAGIAVSTAKIVRLSGQPALTGLVLEDGNEAPAEGLFVAMGQASALDFAKTLGVTARGAFLEADSEQKTNVPGVFAAGDCVGHFMQISVAVGEGAKAGRAAIAHIKERAGRAGAEAGGIPLDRTRLSGL